MGMVHKGGNAVPFHGDHHPVSIYVGDQTIFEPIDQAQDGKTLTFENTYNDVAEVTVFGESTQKTLSGKNLLQTGIAPSKTTNGVTYTRNDDGSITVNGTATKNAFFNLDFNGDISSAVNYWTDYIGREITVSGGNYGVILNCDLITENGLIKTICSSASGNTTTTKVPDDAYKMRSFLYVKSGTTVDNVTIYPQIELGSTATEYEPYCGGIPSPNPSYPMPIVSRTGACVETCGRNIVRETAIRNGDNSQCRYNINHELDCFIGQEVTISFDFNVTKDCVDKVSVYNYQNSGVGIGFSDSIVDYLDVKADETYHYEKTGILILQANGWTYNNGSFIVYPISADDRNGNLVTIRNFKIELGSTGHPYEQFRGTTTDLTSLLDGRELRSLPDGTRDEVYIRPDGSVVLVERVGHVKHGVDFVFNGSVNTNINRSYASSNARNIVAYEDSSTVPVLKCTHLIPSSQNATWKNGMISRAKNIDSLYFCIDPKYTTIDEFNDVLGGCEVDYPLAEPTETVLGTIDLPETFYDTTHIWEANGADISARVRVIPETTSNMLEDGGE